jgi:hypothetical protein
MDPYKSQIKKLIRHGLSNIFIKYQLKKSPKMRQNVNGGCLVKKHQLHQVTSQIDSNNNKVDYLEIDRLQDESTNCKLAD